MEESPRQAVPDGKRARRWALPVLAAAMLVIASGAVAIAFVSPAALSTLRDLLIVWIALAALLAGVALVVLAQQLAQLARTLREEIKPMLEDVGDTISTVQGTARFLSENLAEPVIKVSTSIALLRRLLALFTAGR
jgi:ribose 1,5-bisphosphokinase PhnN